MYQNKGFLRTRVQQLPIHYGVLVLFAILFMGVRVVGVQARPSSQTAPPAQPTNITISHRNGQTFITWTEVPGIVGEKYKIYRSNQPITSANLGSATLLVQVGEGSSRFFSNRYYDDIATTWKYRYVERFVIEHLGPQLAAGTGLFVLTSTPGDFGGAGSGSGYYAITTVSYFGVENTQNFSAGNTAGPVAEAVSEPLPVEINQSMGAGWHVYIQYMDYRQWNPTFNAPNPLNAYFGFSSNDVQVSNSVQYAYDYAVYQPGTAECGSSIPAQLPVVLSLHHYRSNNKFFPTTSAKPWCAYQIYPTDVGSTWWFGFAKNYNYRQHTNGAYPSPGDTIYNYTEQRVLRAIYDLIRQPSGPAVDIQRIYVQGHSMGGSGALAFALRYGNVFAAADASKPMTNYRTTTSFWINDVSLKWGAPASELPVNLSAPAGWASHLQGYNGSSIWDWQNHQQNVQARRTDPMVPVGIAHATNDGTIPWSSQGQPAYGAFNTGQRMWGGQIRQDQHNDASFAGLPPNLQADANGVPFAGFRVVKNETVPGLSNNSQNPLIPPSGTGKFNHSLLWSSSWNAWDGPPQDTASSWQISLCSVDPNAALKTCGSGVQQTVDVTPRRLQAFDPIPGAIYRWENRNVSDGGLVASGTVTAGANGLLTATGVQVGPQGNRLLIWLDGALPSPTPTSPPPPSATPTPTNTAAPPATATNTPVPSPTDPPAPSNTPTPINPPASSPTPTATPTNTLPPVPTNTPTATATSGAGDTGWRSPSANLAAGGGDRNGLEVDPSFAYGDDGVFAASQDSGVNSQITCNAGQEDTHQYYNYGFALPGSAMIDGIEVRLDAWVDSTASSPRFCVSFSRNGGNRWSEYNVTSLTQVTETTYLLGGPSANWGFNWSPADFADGNFRVRIVLDATTNDRDFYLDWIAVRVYYH